MPQCTDEIVARISDPLLLSQWKTSIQTEINRLSQTTGATAATVKDTGITVVETSIAKHLGCAQEKLQATENTPADIVTLQARLAQATKEVSEAQKDVNIAKERARLLRNPERNVTVYEGWFPLFRPLKTSSAFLLIGLTLFMFCVVFAYFMYQFGLFVDVGFLMKVTPGGAGGGLLALFTPFTIGLLLLSIGLAGGLIYYVSK
jgi:hypothetical protein